MVNESCIQAVDKVWEKEAKLFLYSVICIFVLWVMTQRNPMKLSPGVQQGSFIRNKDVENNPTPQSENPNIAVSVNILKSYFPELQLNQPVL